MAPLQPSKQCRRSQPMHGSLNTSPTGPHALNYLPGPEHTTKRIVRMKSQSVLSATLLYVASCSSVSWRWSPDCIANCSSKALQHDLENVMFKVVAAMQASTYNCVRGGSCASSISLQS